MRNGFWGAEDRYEQEQRLERDELREPWRPTRRTGLTARQLAVRARLADICNGATVDEGVLQPPVKVTELCAAGVDHAAVKESPAWQQLAYVGRQNTYDEENNELELRNCACHSTLCKLVAGGAS